MDSSELFIHTNKLGFPTLLQNTETELLLYFILEREQKAFLPVSLFADSLSPPVNVTIKEVKANFAVVAWDIPEGDPVIGFAITQQVSNRLCRRHQWTKHNKVKKIQIYKKTPRCINSLNRQII